MSNLMAKTIESYVVPIIASDADTVQIPKRLLGTAFFVESSRTFLTAWHVIEDARQAQAEGDRISLVVSDGRTKFLSIVEVFRPNVLADIAIGLVDQDTSSLLSLSSERSALGKAVYCLGYPIHLFCVSHADMKFSIPLRFMRGHIQSDVWADHDFLQTRQAVDYYELNFATPRGVSGAPVLLEDTNTVIGICVGTRRGEKLDYIEERRPGEETKVYEIEHIGIAQMSSVVCNAIVPWLV